MSNENWQARAEQAESALIAAQADLKLNAGMLAKQCDLAREAEANRDHWRRECGDAHAEANGLRAELIALRKAGREPVAWLARDHGHHVARVAKSELVALGWPENNIEPLYAGPAASDAASALLREWLDAEPMDTMDEEFQPWIDSFTARAEACLDGVHASDGWLPIESAPKDGSAFLGYGIHDLNANPPKGVQDGDYWRAIILWDKWREPQWVFSKDGLPLWSKPTHWQPLPAAPKAGA